MIDKLELEKLEKAEALRKANAAPVEGTVKPTEEQGGGADKPKTATGEGEGTGKPAPGENGTAAEGEKPPVPVEKGTVAEGEKPLAPGEKGTVTEGEKPPAAEGEQVTGAGEKPPAVTSGTGEGTGNITAGEREVAGGMAKSAALALAQMYADYQVCLAQNKTVEQCKMALGNDIAWGGIIMGGTFLAEGLAGTILAPEAAVVVTTAAAGVGIVMTVKGGYDTAQRFINAPAVAAESGLNQQQKDMLPRFSELVKGVRTDVDTARGLRSQFDSLCDQVNQQAPEAKEVYQNTSALLDQLKGQATLVEKGTGRCSEAAGITAELGALQSSTKDNEGKVNDGLAGARATADNCGSKGDADKIRASYEDCKSLAARMTADAAIAKGRNERLSSIKAEVDVSNADLAAAEEIMDKIGSANTRIHEISSSCISNRDKLNELNDQFVNQKASLGKSIAHLSRLLPDQPPSEVFKAEFQNAYMSVNALKNTFGDFPETLECAFGVADPWGDVTLSSTGLENLFGQAEEAIDSAQNVSTACADIATADAAVDEIGTSADWALYAVGKNEDLLQKADACIAKLDTQKDSVMASAKCPANSTPVWNEQTHDAPCQCNNGYKWDDAGTSCIVDKAEQAAQVEAANCSGTPNSRPYWDEKTSSVRCQYCNKGYHWKGDNGLDCVADIDTGAQVGKSIHSFIDEMAAADAKCMAAGGELDDFGDCQCKDGYKWDDARTKCLVDKAAQLAAWDCSRMPNSTPAWDVVTGAFCQCNKGYKLEGFTKCIVDKQAQVAMADCSGTPNSRPYWDEKANAVRCLYCLQGNHWKDNTGLDCVADNSGGENNHTPSAQGPESAKCVQSKESLRHSIAVYQKQIDCTEEGMRKYGAQIDRRGKTNYWMDCNGNTMYYDLDPRIGIQKTQKYILELQAELNVPCY